MINSTTQEEILKCNKCDYEWLYKGHAIYYLSCPRCRTNIKVRKIEKVKQ
jgi:Zn finger protein HypA/HybF involved in hydrogenase expression